MRVSFRAYLQDVRVRKARELLLVPGYSITEIAQMLGFGGDLPRFDKVFKRFEAVRLTLRLPQSDGAGEPTPECSGQDSSGFASGYRRPAGRLASV